ncbi:hypothetical protein Mal15_48220 [Stieleria maiorica]|uniref:Uncharacterized protein n=1 Tax=Stieleria maiorica TaxID=2795974 RepID=A0A5B9MJZ0_9BACT|nr:hypothetical protein Mal15_48220 [Stieleria maiorica]
MWQSCISDLGSIQVKHNYLVNTIEKAKVFISHIGVRAIESFQNGKAIGNLRSDSVFYGDPCNRKVILNCWIGTAKGRDFTDQLLMGTPIASLPLNQHEQD